MARVFGVETAAGRGVYVDVTGVEIPVIGGQVQAVAQRDGDAGDGLPGKDVVFVIHRGAPDRRDIIEMDHGETRAQTEIGNETAADIEVIEQVEHETGGGDPAGQIRAGEIIGITDAMDQFTFDAQAVAVTVTDGHGAD